MALFLPEAAPCSLSFETVLRSFGELRDEALLRFAWGFPRCKGLARSGASRFKARSDRALRHPSRTAKPLRLKILTVSPWGSRFCRPFPVFSRFYEDIGGRGDPQIRSPTHCEALSTDIHRTAQQTTLRRWHLTPHDPSRAERTLHQLSSRRRSGRRGLPSLQRSARHRRLAAAGCAPRKLFGIACV